MSITSDLTRLVSQAFREAAKTPSLVSARVTSTDPSVISINTKWSVSNLATNNKVNNEQDMSRVDSIVLLHLFRCHSARTFL